MACIIQYALRARSSFPSVQLCAFSVGHGDAVLCKTPGIDFRSHGLFSPPICTVRGSFASAKWDWVRSNCRAQLSTSQANEYVLSGKRDDFDKIGQVLPLFLSVVVVKQARRTHCQNPRPDVNGEHGFVRQYGDGCHRTFGASDRR